VRQRPFGLLDPTWVAATSLIPEANDGMIGHCSTHLGQVIRDDYHHANRLKTAGL
jgi:hypothetical protein